MLAYASYTLIISLTFHDEKLLMVASRQPLVASLRRDAWVEVDLGAIEYNIGVVRSSWIAPQTKIMAVVKSDAYGHGAPGVGELLAASGADWLGVASVDEGLQLVASGVSQPIQVLSPCPSWALSTAVEAGLNITVTDPGQLADINEACQRVQRVAKVHLKIDTGMHRLGIDPGRACSLAGQIAAAKSMQLVGVFSHLAKADDEALTSAQTDCFKRILSELETGKIKPELIHLASSDATRYFPFTHFDMVRPGLLLYGLEPRAVSQVVQPAMSVRGRINHMQEIDAGSSVGYNHTWTAQRRTRTASIPIGYADGIDRGLSNRMTGLLNGYEIKQIGLISMDQMLFDITDVPGVEDGDVITLIGQEQGQTQGPQAGKTLHLSTWANWLDTITYELACRMRARMPRIYTRHKVAERPGT